MCHRGFQQRFFLCAVIFIGLICNYMLRVNINIAIVEMVNDNNENKTDFNSNNSYNNNNKLDWTKAEQEWVKAAFFYGYCVMNVPGGRLGEVFGTKRVFGYSIVAAALLAIATPLLAKIDVWIIFALRIGQVKFNS